MSQKIERLEKETENDDRCTTNFFLYFNYLQLKVIIYKTDSQEFQDYLSDASNFKGHCEGVYFPKDANETSEILREANRRQTRITIAGNRTGLRFCDSHKNKIISVIW